jgi:hypothetical protein
LGDTKVSHEDQAKLPGMGISKWASLLVYQRDNLPGRSATELAREDENVPTVRGLPIHIASPNKMKL